MKKLNYEKLNAFITSDVIKPFYEIRLSRLESAKLSDISKRKNLRNAKKLLRAAGKKDIVSVNGCMYGRDNVPHKVNKNPDLSYYKICGQAFWELISGDDQLYKKIIQPLDKEAKKRDEVFKTLYVKKINEMTKDAVDRFYTKDNLDWEKIIDYVSKK